MRKIEFNKSVNYLRLIKELNDENLMSKDLEESARKFYKEDKLDFNEIEEFIWFALGFFSNIDNVKNIDNIK